MLGCNLFFTALWDYTEKQNEDKAQGGFLFRLCYSGGVAVDNAEQGRPGKGSHDIMRMTLS